MSEKTEQMEDIELFSMLRGSKAESEKAFSELYARHSSRVYAYCRRFLGNAEEASDVFQDTFCRFYESSKQDREMTHVPAYFLRISINLCVNTKRGEKPNIVFEDYMVVKHNSDRQDKDELLNLIKMSLDLLPDNYREMFVLREYDGLSYQEISEVTDIPVATVKVRLYRAKKTLRKILAPYLADLSQFE
jgi:RNA polymerase sigma-70 factor (ECF subfamily)